jgi:hypothetical protein
MAKLDEVKQAYAAFAKAKVAYTKAAQAVSDAVVKHTRACRSSRCRLCRAKKN